MQIVLLVQHEHSPLHQPHLPNRLISYLLNVHQTILRDPVIVDGHRTIPSTQHHVVYIHIQTVDTGL